jgi:hypothetical protein
LEGFYLLAAFLYAFDYMLSRLLFFQSFIFLMSLSEEATTKNEKIDEKSIA